MGILDNAKEVAKAVQEIHNLELYQRVLTLHSDIIKIVEENNRLRDENKDLTKTIGLRQEMVFKEPFYYRASDETPHCPSCWENKSTAVHLVHVFEDSESTRWDCPSCNYPFRIKRNRTTQSRMRQIAPRGTAWS